jgi:hypothetical protein
MAVTVDKIALRANPQVCLSLQTQPQDHCQTGWDSQRGQRWITGHACTNEGDRYGVNPLSRMAGEIQKFPSIAKAAGLFRGE